jgi:hypothetical protein
MLRTLGFRILKRVASDMAGGTTQARTSVDFTIDGAGLLAHVVSVAGGHADFMGCFVRGFAESNRAKLELLSGSADAETADGRVLLYVCPECGDMGCGSYAAKVKVSAEVVEWFDFAYENGYEPARPLQELGPFVFALKQYMSTVTAASEA